MKSKTGTENDLRLPRRLVVQGALAGLAVAGALPLAAPPAAAAPASPGAGAVVTPNPIKPKIRKSGVAVELVDFATIPPSNPTPALANLNFLYHVGDGSGRLLVNDTRGKMWEVDRATGAATLFLDLAAARRGKLIITPFNMGFRSFAFHPDFSRPGLPGSGRFYTASTERAESPRDGAPLITGPYRTHHHDVIAEWSVAAGNPRLANPSSRREVLRLEVWKTEHNTDQLMFDPNAGPGSPGYGLMFVGTGDGGNVPSSPDPFNAAQNLGLPLGKILRIDPLRQAGGASYGVPADNPFVATPGARPEVWAYGLRHPQNLSFDRGGNGAFVLIDIGQGQVEEVNVGIRGANYGWALREGPYVTDRATSRLLYALPPDDAANGFTYPAAVYDHSEGIAITGGFVYRGGAVPRLAGHYIFGDIVNGRVFHLPVSDLRPGGLLAPRELTLRRNGAVVTLLQLVGQANGRVDLRFGQDESGEVYIMSKQDGVIRRIRAA